MLVLPDKDRDSVIEEQIKNFNRTFDFGVQSKAKVKKSHVDSFY